MGTSLAAHTLHPSFIPSSEPQQGGLEGQPHAAPNVAKFANLLSVLAVYLQRKLLLPVESPNFLAQICTTLASAYLPLPFVCSKYDANLLPLGMEEQSVPGLSPQSTQLVLQLANALGLGQDFGMFAPEPAYNDGWFNAVAKLSRRSTTLHQNACF